MSLRILITAGPTREPIDPVRYLTNRSSGKMGYALAAAASEAGHAVTLISGPVELRPPAVASYHAVETAQQMFDVVEREIAGVDVAIFCAAVADYRPKVFSSDKIKKADSDWSLELERTPDILGSARSKFDFRGILVGFAAETENLEENALGKLGRKGCDLLIANDVGKPGMGFGSDQNEATAYFSEEEKKPLPAQSKQAMAEKIVEMIQDLSPRRGDA